MTTACQNTTLKKQWTVWWKWMDEYSDHSWIN